MQPFKGTKRQSGWAFSSWLPWGMVALTLAVFGATVWFVTARLERSIRQQTVARDGEVLHAVMLMQQVAERELDPAFSLADEAAQFRLLLQATKLRGVLGVRLFDREGRFVTGFPEYVAEAALPSADLAVVTRLESVSRFNVAQPIAPVLSAKAARAPGTGEAPLLEVVVPIHELDGNQCFGAAQFLIDGQPLADRLQAIHRVVSLQAWLVFLTGGTLISAGLGWTLRRLQERTARLAKANHELALAAKTTAVGAISSHLIHGLKSPLFGLQNIFAGRKPAEGQIDPAWETAIRATRQMQQMINRVMNLLRNAEGLEGTEISLRALLAEVMHQAEPLAHAADVRLTAGAAPDATVSSDTGNLVLIILSHLVQNAIEATPAGRSVSVSANRKPDGSVEFEVRDEGPGIPPAVANTLFLPCESTKPGGGGVGLSICKQLADHLNSRLELRASTSEGSVFAFRLSAGRLAGAAGASPPQSENLLVV